MAKVGPKNVHFASTMSTSPALYNISLTDQSAYIQFFPYRDGPVDSQWNVSYSDSRFSDWSSNPFGVGSSHNTTLIGAYALLEWAGTGVWFYGTMRNGEYTIKIDDGIPSSGDGAIDGVLFGQDGLAYGFHKALINVTGNTEMSSITGATITVGMGESGTVRLQRIINATVNSGSLAANPFFVVNDGSEWSAETLYDQSHPYPCIATSITGSSMSFNLTESVGFALYGSDDYQQGLFVVNVTIPGQETPSYIPPASIQYSPRSQWTGLNQLKFIATGMNQSQTYNVNITNQGANFNLASVVVYSAIPSPTSNATSPGNSKSISANSLTSTPLPKPSSALLPVSRSLNSGAIAGAAIGGFVAVLIVAVLVVLAIRRRRRQQEAAALLTVPTIYTEEGSRTVRDMRLVSGTLEKSSHIVAPTSQSGGESTILPLPTLTSSVPPASVEPPTTISPGAYMATSFEIREIDAGPVIQPPSYDPSWAEAERISHP